MAAFTTLLFHVAVFVLLLCVPHVSPLTKQNADETPNAAAYQKARQKLSDLLTRAENLLDELAARYTIQANKDCHSSPCTSSVAQNDCSQSMTPCVYSRIENMYWRKFYSPPSTDAERKALDSVFFSSVHESVLRKKILIYFEEYKFNRLSPWDLKLRLQSMVNLFKFFATLQKCITQKGKRKNDCTMTEASQDLNKVQKQETNCLDSPSILSKSYDYVQQIYRLTYLEIPKFQSTELTNFADKKSAYREQLQIETFQVLMSARKDLRDMCVIYISLVQAASVLLSPFLEWALLSGPFDNISSIGASHLLIQYVENLHQAILSSKALFPPACDNCQSNSAQEELMKKLLISINEWLQWLEESKGTCLDLRGDPCYVSGTTDINACVSNFVKAKLIWQSVVEYSTSLMDNWRITYLARHEADISKLQKNSHIQHTPKSVASMNICIKNIFTVQEFFKDFQKAINAWYNNMRLANMIVTEIKEHA